MRELRFRAWDSLFHKWIPAKTLNEWVKSSVSYEDKNIDWSQFTGLQDSNGVDVFEGDVLSFKYEDGLVFCFVYWCEIHCGFRGKNNDGYEFILNSSTVEKCGVKVIGNVNQHPELLNEV